MIYVIGGPTGTGKTELALRLAKRWNAPILNADAFQTYQMMNIGTNKDMRAFIGYDHYLFDWVPPNEPMTVARFQKEARKLLDQFLLLKKPIIIVGGTGLYIKATLYDFTFAEYQHPVEMDTYATWDNQSLHQLLSQLDLVSSQRIHPNNRRRVLRAIAIHQTTGESKSKQEASQHKKPLYQARYIGIILPRASLYRHLDDRVDKMIHQGLFTEVQSLLDHYGPTCQAFQAIGYKESLEYLLGKKSLSETIEKIKQSTRRYAKRQMTYFQHQFPMEWYPSIEEAEYGVIK